VEPILSEPEIRALACLIEKESTTPEYYPLSLNALTLACNQKTNRDPVVSYGEDTVREALEGLRERRLARAASQVSRVEKFEHSILEVFNLGRRELALLCALMLRGPQTVGELRDRAGRLRPFSDLAEVETCLETLIRWEPAPLAARLPRQPGTKEPRYIHLLGGGTTTSQPIAISLEEQVASLREELRELREQFEGFRKQLGDG
jgi:uncharacterized protein